MSLIYHFARWPVVAIGTAGILSNFFSLYYNFRRKGFPRQLYIILNVIDISVCLIGILFMGRLLYYNMTYNVIIVYVITLVTLMYCATKVC